MNTHTITHRHFFPFKYEGRQLNGFAEVNHFHKQENFCSALLQKSKYLTMEREFIYFNDINFPRFISDAWSRITSQKFRQRHL